MKLFTWLIAFTAFSMLSGCSWIKPIKPWVKPYERQNIADPLMSFSRDPAADSYLSHVRDAREGASGADGGAGGGCGCN
jgi:hypothetical protein